MKLSDETISQREKAQKAASRGFSLVELLVVAAILLVVLGGVVSYITDALQRSKAEQTKVDLTQEGRAFVDEFERDIHQAGYPNCRMFNIGTCTTAANYSNASVAAGLVLVSNTQIVFEGDMDGDGVVDSVRYQLIDSANNNPLAAGCPCTVQRSQMPKVAGNPLTGQTAPTWSQELQNVVNSGVPAGGAQYGGGQSINGNVLFGGGAQTNTAYYAAVATFKDYPVFSAYDQNGNIVPLPADISTAAGQQALASIKSIRLTINLLGSGTSGYDAKTKVRPIVTLAGNGRINN